MPPHRCMLSSCQESFSSRAGSGREDGGTEVVYCSRPHTHARARAAQWPRVPAQASCPCWAWMQVTVTRCAWPQHGGVGRHGARAAYLISPPTSVMRSCSWWRMLSAVGSGSAGSSPANPGSCSADPGGQTRHPPARPQQQQQQQQQQRVSAHAAAGGDNGGREVCRSDGDGHCRRLAARARVGARLLRTPTDPSESSRRSCEHWERVRDSVAPSSGSWSGPSAGESMGVSSPAAPKIAPS
jgi:hypothetical protein